MTEYYEIVRKLDLLDSRLWVRPFVNAYYYDDEIDGVGMLRNVDAHTSTVDEIAEEVETRPIRVEKGVVELEGKKRKCVAFKREFLFGHFCVITENDKNVIARYRNWNESRTLSDLVALSREQARYVLELERLRRKKWKAVPMYVISPPALDWILDKPPLVNLWVLDPKTKYLRNYYRHQDEVVKNTKIEFKSVDGLVKEADTSQEPVNVLNPNDLWSGYEHLAYFVQCKHQLKDKTRGRLVTLRNVDDLDTDKIGHVSVMGWMRSSGVTVIRPTEIRDTQKEEGTKRKQTWKREER